MINQIRQHNHSLSFIGKITEEAKLLMRCFTTGIEQYVRREANSTAHTLAEEALSLDEGLFMVEECPASLIPILETDCNFNQS